ncbi:hypothetical protein OOT46_00760 [Aquabacterium sp. A7-Y]|uniref:glutaredoxin family protein n=1 Tax=Aquabacterium sp. A7-Y TaxID=1349605 RepID=UPI00223D4994|nr:glutaredoxin domain-containing protein [Aquabacterium sp. A7-Y]MCW7536384.1 hypothetical protein [Aquabacterium sp. A7-Y]
MSRVRRFLSLAVIAGVLLGGAALARWWSEREIERALVRHAGPHDIVMFTTTDCPYCAEARSWLDARQVPYTECNTSTSAACRTSYERLRAPGVPTLVVRGERQVGFDPERIARVLQR